MAPLRSRANRNQGDDETSILKGLPIRQWRLTEEKIGPPIEVKPDLGKQIFPELPLPRDFHMLPEISQLLLRKARAGQIYHSPAPPSNAKDEKSKSGPKEAEGGFVSKKWTLVARDQEAEEPTYLAKRRKGLPPSFGVGLGTLAPQTSYRTTKVKKYDADGKLHVYEVLAPEGQQVEGEVVAEDEAAKAAPVEPIAAVPGTVVEGVGVVNEQGVVVSNDLLQPTPPRRKPPPPRRKPKKGPGRGKKKVLFEGGEAADAVNADGAPASGLLNVPGAAAERATDSAVPSSQGDTPMPDAGDDDEGSGSEGEEGEEGEDGREEGELSPSPEPEKAEAKSEPPEDAVAPVTTTEIKEEEKEDDAMDTEEQLRQQEEIPLTTEAGANAITLPPAPPPATAAQKSSTPPSLQRSKSPSLPLPAAVKEVSSSPEMPLASASGETTQIPGLPALAEEKVGEQPESTPVVNAEPVTDSATAPVVEQVAEPVAEPIAEPVVEPATIDHALTQEAENGAGGELKEVKKDGDGDVDLLASLEATLDQEGEQEKKETSA